MNRRGFLAAIGAAVVGKVVAPGDWTVTTEVGPSLISESLRRAELKLAMEEYSARYLAPAAAELERQINYALVRGYGFFRIERERRLAYPEQVVFDPRRLPA